MCPEGYQESWLWGKLPCIIGESDIFKYTLGVTGIPIFKIFLVVLIIFTLIKFLLHFRIIE